MIAAVFKTFFNSIFNLIYPPNCLLCRNHLLVGAEEKVLCAACLEGIERNHPPFCRKCSRPLWQNPDGSLCRECQKTDYPFDRAWGATVYNETMQKLIHLFKYQNKTSLRKVFSIIIDTFIENHGIDVGRFDIVVPVPLHPARLRERGYNQSELLSESLAEKYRRPLMASKLLRQRHTPNQALLGKKERWTNIRSAFTIKDRAFFKKKSVLLVDDLLTTGATVSEAARILKDAGAKEVSALTLSIAIL